MNCEEVERRGLVELYVADRLAEPDREEFEAHYFDCDRCFEAVETAGRIRAGLAEKGVEAVAEEPVAGSGAAPASRTPWLAPVAAVLVAAAVVAAVIVFLPGDGGHDGSLAPLGALSTAELPPYVDANLRNGGGVEGRTAFESGMDAYALQDWNLAARRLEGAVEADPTRALWRFYLGASLLADRRPEEAIDHLRAAATEPMFREEARWLLAKAWLQRGEAEPARANLEELLATGGERADDARALLERIDRAVESR